jgi:hypothetical protein
VKFLSILRIWVVFSNTIFGNPPSHLSSSRVFIELMVMYYQLQQRNGKEVPSKKNNEEEDQENKSGPKDVSATASSEQTADGGAAGGGSVADIAETAKGGVAGGGTSGVAGSSTGAKTKTTVEENEPVLSSTKETEAAGRGNSIDKIKDVAAGGGKGTDKDHQGRRSRRRQGHAAEDCREGWGG